MGKEKVILLDEYDFYKAENDSTSRNFLKEQDLYPVLIDSAKGLQIIGRKSYQSGTIMVQSPNNKNNYFSILNAIQDYKDEYFEILMTYAPLLGASEITIRCNIDESQVEKANAKHKASVNIPTSEINTEYHHSSLSDKMRSLKREQHQKTKPSSIDTESVIEKLKVNGINYEVIPILKRMLNRELHLELLKDSIEIVEIMKESKTTLGRLSTNVGIKKIPILKKVGVEYEGESASELILMNETKIEIEIKFHD